MQGKRAVMKGNDRQKTKRNHQISVVRRVKCELEVSVCVRGKGRVSL